MLTPVSSRSAGLLAVLTVTMVAFPAAALKLIWSPEELRADLEARLPAEDAAQLPIPFEIDDEIRAWAAEVTAGLDNADDVAKALARAIIKDERLRTVYDRSTTITAREAFRAGRANCISLTNLFVGIARDMGLPAYYVDVTQATTVSRVQDRIVAQGHICAGIRFPHGFVLYDFADRPERPYRGYSLLDDREALATFVLARHLNETLTEPDPARREELLARVREDTALALRVKPDFAKAHVNLGTAYLRLGHREDAVASYQRALSIDPRLVAANLAIGYVYAQDGQWTRARAAYEQAKQLLPGDALVRYHLGVASYHDGDLGAARRNLEAALRLEPDLREAWSGLGLTYRALGREDDAIDAFLNARNPTTEVEPADGAAPAGAVGVAGVDRVLY